MCVAILFKVLEVSGDGRAEIERDEAVEAMRLYHEIPGANN